MVVKISQALRLIGSYKYCTFQREHNSCFSSFRWIAGIVVNNTTLTKNLHNHSIPSPSVVSTFVKHSIVSAVSASPRLTTDDLAAGRGLQFVPGAVDTAAASKDKLRGIRKKALEDGGHRRGKQTLSLPHTIISL